MTNDTPPLAEGQLIEAAETSGPVPTGGSDTGESGDTTDHVVTRDVEDWDDTTTVNPPPNPVLVPDDPSQLGGATVAVVWQRVRETRPRILCIVEPAEIARLAEAVRAIGAIPVFPATRDEVLDLVTRVDAIVVDAASATATGCGTPLSTARARGARPPVLFLPREAGVSALRLNESRRFVAAVRPEVLRGNASDLGAVIGWETPVHDETTGATLATRVAVTTGAVVSLSAGRGSTPSGILSDGRYTRTVGQNFDLTDSVAIDCVTEASIATVLAIEPDARRAVSLAIELVDAALRSTREHQIGPRALVGAVLDTLAGVAIDGPVVSATTANVIDGELLAAIARIATVGRSITSVSDTAIIGEALGAIRAGATMIHLAVRDRPDRQAVALVREVVARVRSLGRPVLVIDRVDLAWVGGADGVHLDDPNRSFPVDQARRLLGSGAIIGVTVDSVVAAEAAVSAGATYLLTPAHADTETDVGIDVALRGRIGVPVVALRRSADPRETPPPHVEAVSSFEDEIR